MTIKRQSSLRVPVSWSIIFEGAGPIPQTVNEPSLIYVKPASAITQEGIDKSFAFDSISNL